MSWVARAHFRITAWQSQSIYEKCCQPWGEREIAPLGVMSVIGEMERFDAVMRPTRVTGTPSILDGTRAAGGAVNRSS